MPKSDFSYFFTLLLLRLEYQLHNPHKRKDIILLMTRRLPKMLFFEFFAQNGIVYQVFVSIFNDLGLS